MNAEARESIILNYIAGYNQFDVEQMVQDFDSNIRFENVQNKVVTDTLQGIEEFVHQANEAKNYFTQRTQTILKIEHFEYNSIIDISFQAVLAVDFSENLKAGDRLELLGQSIFEFTEDHKIIKLIDIS